MQPAISDLATSKAQFNESGRKRTLLAFNDAPFNDLLFQTQAVHRQNFNPNKVQLSRLLRIKTGGCPEDCGYCSQLAQGFRHKTLYNPAVTPAR